MLNTTQIVLTFISTLLLICYNDNKFGVTLRLVTTVKRCDSQASVIRCDSRASVMSVTLS